MSELPRPPADHTVTPGLLLVVDPQRGFVTDASRPVLERIQRAQACFDKVIYSRFVNLDPSPFRRILDWHRLGAGSDDVEFALEPPPDTPVVVHETYSSVTPHFRFILEDCGIKEVCVAGIATEACILKTVIDLFESNIVTWVVTDLCASDKDGHFHDIAIEVIGAMIGQRYVITSHALDMQAGLPAKAQA